MINEIDAQILNIIQNDGRVSNAEIARQVGMAPSGVLERIRKLEARGVIRGYETRLDPKALGLGVLAFIFVRVSEADAAERMVKTEERLMQIPEAQEVHHIAGEDCYLVKVRAASTEDLGRLLKERIGTIESVRATRTTIVLGTLKESAQLPLPEIAGDEKG